MYLVIAFRTTLACIHPYLAKCPHALEMSQDANPILKLKVNYPLYDCMKDRELRKVELCKKRPNL
jgi:hypothetical protein